MSLDLGTLNLNYLRLIDLVSIYFLIINVIAFLSFGFDKWRARTHGWRIKEGSLLLLAILGGGIGSLLGMYLFRHKTSKKKFSLGIPIIIILNWALLFYNIKKLG